MSIEHLIDEYITKIPEPTIIGHCNNCGELVEDGIYHSELEGQLYCNDECIKQYYEVEEHTLIEYCTECDYSIEESYIEDVYNNKFCDLDCLKKYYK